MILLLTPLKTLYSITDNDHNYDGDDGDGNKKML